MILLEGPNLCGKTTVGMKLRETLGRFSYRHTTRPMVPNISYRLWQLADAHSFMIFDRCHWSDWAYAHGAGFLGLDLGPEDTGWTAGDWRLIELAFMSRGAHVLCLMDTAEGILSRWTEEVDATQVRKRPSVEELNNLLVRYAALLGGESVPRSHIPCVMADLPTVLQPDWLDEFCRLSIMRASRAAFALPPSMGIGSPDAEFMVLADDYAPGPPIGVTEKDAVGSTPDLPFSRGWDEWWTQVDRSQLAWWKGYYTLSAAFQNDPVQFGAYCGMVTPQVRTFVCLGPKAMQMVTASLAGSPAGSWGCDVYAIRNDPAGREVGVENICFSGLTRWRQEHSLPVARLWHEPLPEAENGL